MLLSFQRIRPIIRDDRARFNLYVNGREVPCGCRGYCRASYKKDSRCLLVQLRLKHLKLFRKYLLKKGIPHNVLNAKNHEREAEIIANAGQKGAVTIATNMAGRGTDIKLGEGVKELGGLAVIGTERHESRRIDNQLRGRSGRQGDPGITQFYLIDGR